MTKANDEAKNNKLLKSQQTNEYTCCRLFCHRPKLNAVLKRWNDEYSAAISFLSD